MEMATKLSMEAVERVTSNAIQKSQMVSDKPHSTLTCSIDRVVQRPWSEWEKGRDWAVSSDVHQVKWHRGKADVSSPWAKGRERQLNGEVI